MRRQRFADHVRHLARRGTAKRWRRWGHSAGAGVGGAGAGLTGGRRHGHREDAESRQPVGRARTEQLHEASEEEVEEGVPAEGAQADLCPGGAISEEEDEDEEKEE